MPISDPSDRARFESIPDDGFRYPWNNIVNGVAPLSYWKKSGEMYCLNEQTGAQRVYRGGGWIPYSEKVQQHEMETTQQKGNRGILPALIILFTLSVGGFWVYDKIQKAIQEVAQEDEAEIPRRNPESATSISVIDLYRKYKDNGLRFAQEYYGKTVTADGIIQSIEKWEIGRSDVAIILGYTSCNLEGGENEKAMQLSAGSKVTVQGVVTSTIAGFSLEDCVILQ